jgi:hypothetical protein
MFEENEMFEQFSSKFAAYFSLYVTGNKKTTTTTKKEGRE